MSTQRAASRTAMRIRSTPPSATLGIYESRRNNSNAEASAHHLVLTCVRQPFYLGAGRSFYNIAYRYDFMWLSILCPICVMFQRCSCVAQWQWYQRYRQRIQNTPVYHRSYFSPVPISFDWPCYREKVKIYLQNIV